ncbi:UPF0158 family protein [Robertmurraya andreesenii]|uniref:DUF1642 domain-containing protein n=1 Tax=Anoxybacillus andreesenii TaxID=1325932 RepID=A0ABT9V134_9BACL|nr:UPF0158 family protein [Robertmurraya andreesenii]MDQ0154654.1 hypothetical protein [Robertmurraya andreesenii]
MKVKLEQIIEGMEMQSEESRSFLNLKTGEVVYVSREVLTIAEDDDEYTHLPEWQQDELETAKAIVFTINEYASLPSSFDINEYNMMEDFCYSLSDHQKRDLLLNSIHGKGAFRRFKDNIQQLEVSDQWYAFRDQKYKEIAIEFCKSKNLDYIE